MQGPKWKFLLILIVYGPCVVILKLLGQVFTLGRAPRTKEVLPDFHEWCQVTRHPRVFRELTGCQRTPRFWGVTLGNNTTPTREKLGKNTTPINGKTSKLNVDMQSPDRLHAVTVKPLSFIMHELQHCRREEEGWERSMTRTIKGRQLFIKKPGRLESLAVRSDSP